MRRTIRSPRSLARCLSFESLETRNLLAVVNLVDGNLVVTDPGTTNDNLTVISDAANQRFQISDPGNLITSTISGATGSGTNTLLVPFAAVTGNEVQILTLGGTDTVAVGGQFAQSVTIVTGAAADTVNLNANLTLAAGRSLSAVTDTINVGADANIITSGAGAVTFTADTIAIHGTATIASEATATLQAQVASRLINVGTENVSHLSLTDAELDRITADRLQIGNAAHTGGLFVTAPITHANHLSLISNAGITVSNAVTMAQDKNFSIGSPSMSGVLSFNNAAADVTTSGTGAISIVAARTIELAVAGASLTTEDGGITISADASAFPVALSGVNILATITSTGTGDISITGRGTGGSFGGVVIEGVIQSTSATNTPDQGRITIHGLSGATGIRFSANGHVLSNGGDIELIA